MTSNIYLKELRPSELVIFVGVMLCHHLIGLFLGDIPFAKILEYLLKLF